MFCLNAEDIIPLGDIAVVNTSTRIVYTSISLLTEMENVLHCGATEVLRILLWHYYLRKRNRTVEY
jgi:DNA-3-methyladenine glycosylase II